VSAPRHVLVVGGGFAGLAAAVRLVRGGARVTLLERRPFLGGRAYSFTDAASGDVIDNGPHAFMGAYTALAAFCAEIGAADAIAFQPRLHVPMAHPVDGLGAVAAPRVPGPLQGPAALLGYRLLSRADRLRLALAAVRLATAAPAALAGRTVAELLAACRQSAAACRRFWDPLVVATLNEVPEQAAVAPFAAVLRRGFLAGARAARFGVARAPLGDAFAAPARAAIERGGGTVRTNAAVAAIDVVGARAAGVVLRDGWRIAADAVIVAVPAPALRRLAPGGIGGDVVPAATTSPIVSVHLWTDADVPVGAPAAGAPFVGLLETRVQWLFDCGPSRAGGRRLATVTSGARAWEDVDDDRIVAEAVADLRRTLPGQRDFRPVRAHVVRERHATLSLTPEVERARPDATTALPNLFLAGDWVRTGLPATIEGAVAAGMRAAQLALAARLERPAAAA
jgi:squalene-associated FAD-dependent desaturase